MGSFRPSRDALPCSLPARRAPFPSGWCLGSAEFLDFLLHEIKEGQGDTLPQRLLNDLDCFGFRGLRQGFFQVNFLHRCCFWFIVFQGDANAPPNNQPKAILTTQGTFPGGTILL